MNCNEKKIILAPSNEGAIFTRGIFRRNIFRRGQAKLWVYIKRELEFKTITVNKQFSNSKWIIATILISKTSLLLLYRRIIIILEKAPDRFFITFHYIKIYFYKYICSKVMLFM